MLSNPPLRIAFGGLLLALTLLGAAFAIGRPVVRHNRRHVTIEVFNNSSVVQIFVNCHEAAVVRRGQVTAIIDLGWLKPSDRVFISATSRDARPSFGFLGRSNGRRFIEVERGSVEVLGFPAEPNAVVFAKGFLGSGEPLGNTGCQPPGVVAVPDYLQSPTDARVPAVKGDKPSYRPQRAPYDQIDAIGGWVLIPLGVLGLVTALAIEPSRRLILRHRKIAGAVGVAATIAALFFGSLGAAALVTSLKVGGGALLFAMAVALTVTPLWRRLEHAEGPRPE